jgi:hypothetical protein
VSNATLFEAWHGLPINEATRWEWAREQLIEMSRRANAEGKDLSYEATTTSSGDSMLVTTSIRLSDGSHMIDQYDVLIRRHRVSFVPQEVATPLLAERGKESK